MMAGKQLRRFAFPLLVLLGALLAIGAALEADAPPDIPSYALDSVVVYKCEVGLVLFLLVYVFVATVSLAMEGRTLGKISTTGIELPGELSASVAAQQELAEELGRVQREVTAQGADLAEDVACLWEAVERIQSDRERG
jgi:hypothetical protein